MKDRRYPRIRPAHGQVGVEPDAAASGKSLPERVYAPIPLSI
jgi:hypothetical protein